MLKLKEKSFLIFFAFVVLTLIASVALGVTAATEATVTATVSAQNIAVTVDDGSITYGTIGVGSSTDTTTSDLNDSQTVVNEGNVTQNFNIRGQNSTSIGIGWTLASSPATNEYAHRFCTSGCDASPSWTALTTSPQTLFSGKGVGTSTPFDLQLQAPTTTTDYEEQSVDVTVIAIGG